MELGRLDQLVAFSGMVVMDGFAVFGRFVLLIMAGLGLLAGWRLVESLDRAGCRGDCPGPPCHDWLFDHGRFQQPRDDVSWSRDRLDLALRPCRIDQGEGQGRRGCDEVFLAWILCVGHLRVRGGPSLRGNRPARDTGNTTVLRAVHRDKTCGDPDRTGPDHRWARLQGFRSAVSQLGPRRVSGVRLLVSSGIWRRWPRSPGSWR